HRVEKLRFFNREQKKRELIIAQCAKRIFGKPNGVRQPDAHRFVGSDERCGLKNGVAQPGRMWLHDKSDRDRTEISAAVIFQDVRFSRRDHKTKLAGAARDHSIDKVFADGTGTLDCAIKSTTDGEQFLRKREWLNSR